MSSLFTNLKSLLLIILFVSLVCPQISFAQGHPLAGNKSGGLYFLKNLTTDDQVDFAADTCSVYQTSKEVIPEIWVRVFLNNTLQSYIDEMKAKHKNVLKMKIFWNFHFIAFLYKDGKLIAGDKNAVGKFSDEIIIKSLEGNDFNTVMLKLNDSEGFVKGFNFYAKSFTPEKGLEKRLQIGVGFRVQCVYVNVLEKTKTEYCLSPEGFEALAGVTEQDTQEPPRYLKIIIK